MDKYIKLEPLLKELEENMPYNWSDEDYEQGEVNGYKYAVSIVEAQDTADVAEVKHGEWHCSSVSMKTRNITCRHCRRTETISNGRTNFDFCPNCGARMDGEGG